MGKVESIAGDSERAAAEQLEAERQMQLEDEMDEGMDPDPDEELSEDEQAHVEELIAEDKFAEEVARLQKAKPAP